MAELPWEKVAIDIFKFIVSQVNSSSWERALSSNIRVSIQRKVLPVLEANGHNGTCYSHKGISFQDASSCSPLRRRLEVSSPEWNHVRVECLVVVPLWNKAEGVCVSCLTACKWSPGMLLIAQLRVYFHVCVCRGAGVHVWTCMHIHMKTRRIYYTSILPSTFFKDRLYHLPQLPQDAGVVDQRTLGICLTPPPQPWDCKWVFPHSAFWFGFWALYLLSHPISHTYFCWNERARHVTMAASLYPQRFRAMDEGCSWKSRLASRLCSSWAPFFWDDWWRGLSEKNKLFLIFLVILSFPGMISSGHFVWAHTEGLYSRCFLSIF